MRSAHRGAVALSAAVLAAAMSGCGIDTEKAGRPDAGVSTTTTATTSTTGSDRTRRLPKRPPGVVEVRGPVQGSLTPLAVPGVSGIRVNFAGEGEEQGIEDLCAGRIDVLDTSRLITEAERRRCALNGVDLAAPIQIASDAVIVATPNASDVGGDCLRVSTVNDIFRVGSPITNWSQVGFFGIPLRTTGPQPQSPTFQFFGQTVLGVPNGGSLADVRSDYRPRPTQDEVRREVTSTTRVERVRRRWRDRIDALEFDRGIAFQEAIDRAISDARDRVLAQIEAENERLARKEIVLTDFQKAEIRRRNRRRIEMAIADAQARAEARFRFPQLTLARARYREQLRRARQKGTIGIFRFTYYELYEQQLRPMEIWDPRVAATALEAMRGVRIGGEMGAAGPGGSATTQTAPTAEGTVDVSTTETTTTGTATSGAPTEITRADAPAGAADADVVVDSDQTPWCVFPSQQTITNGAYPLARRLVLYVSGLNLQREEVRTFLRSYVDRAQQLASSQRLVPIPDDLVERNRAIIDGTRETTPGRQGETSGGRRPGDLPGVGRGAATTATTTTP